MLPKLIVTDLDGTALRDDKTISPRTSEAFAACKNAGIPVAIATARYITGAAPYAKALQADYQILTDGTLVFHGKNLIYSNVLTPEKVDELLMELKKNHCISHIAIPTTEVLFRYPDGVYYDPANPDPAGATCPDNVSTVGYHIELDEPFPCPASKIVADIPSEDIAKDIATKLGLAHFHYRGESRYTFYSTTASKLDAITHIAKSLDISLKDILVFGDDVNDIEMISHCGIGVAMENALPQVKTASDFVTGTNQEDGVACYLENILSQ